MLDGRYRIERRIGLGGEHPFELGAEVAERRLKGLSQFQVVEHLAKQPADQKLERQIVDTLLVLDAQPALRFRPVVDDAVARGQRRLRVRADDPEAAQVEVRQRTCEVVGQ